MKSDKRKRTPWFPGTVKPARGGVYEVLVEGFETPSYSFWNEKYWGWVAMSPSWATYDGQRKSNFMNGSYRVEVQWRGLAEKP